MTGYFRDVCVRGLRQPAPYCRYLSRYVSIAPGTWTINVELVGNVGSLGVALEGFRRAIAARFHSYVRWPPPVQK